MKIFDKNLDDEYRSLLDANREKTLDDKFTEKEIENFEKDARGVIYQDSRGNILDIEDISKNKEKLPYSYRTHEERLKDEGWDRALSIREVFSLLIDNCKGKVTFDQSDIAAHILNGEQEYLSTGIVRYKDVLHVCEGARGLRFDKDSGTYTSNRLDWHVGESIFDISKLRHGWNMLSNVNFTSRNLIDYIFNMEYEKIPENIRRGEDRCRIHLWDDSEIWPLIIGVDSKYSFGGFDEVAASRGVRVLK